MPARSSSVSSRRTFAGTPATSEPGGTIVPSSTTAPAATSDPAPISAWLSTVAFMPIRQSSPIVHPWTTAPWPMLTPEPIDDRRILIDVHDHVVLQVACARRW